MIGENLNIAIIIIGLILIIILAESIIETHTFKVTHYPVNSPKLHETDIGKTVVVLSDLHNKSYGKNNEKLIKEIKNQSPVLIVVAGDMLVGKKEISYRVAEDLMHQLIKICPIFYVNGNHEQRMKEQPELYKHAYDEFKKSITSKGVVMLENNSCFRDWDDNLAVIAGLEIPIHYYKKNCRKKISVKEIEQCIGKADTGCYQVLITHNPAHMKAYKAWGADLVVAGHFHGGIIRIPFIGGIITPQAQLFPKYSGGIYKDGNTTYVVSKGLGDHTVRIRLMNRAEIVVLHIGKKIKN